MDVYFNGIKGILIKKKWIPNIVLDYDLDYDFAIKYVSRGNNIFTYPIIYKIHNIIREAPHETVLLFYLIFNLNNFYYRLISKFAH